MFEALKADRIAPCYTQSISNAADHIHYLCSCLLEYRYVLVHCKWDVVSKFWFSAIFKEKKAKGQGTVLLYSFSSVSPYVNRTPLLPFNEWAQEISFNVAQIRFLLISSTSAFYCALGWVADSLNKEQKAAIYCSELVPTFWQTPVQVASCTISHRWLPGQLPRLHSTRLTTLSHTEMRWLENHIFSYSFPWVWESNYTFEALK